MGAVKIFKEAEGSQKSVSDLIFDKFAEYVRKDRLFDGVSEDLITLVRKKKPNKSEIEKLLRKTQDEDTKPER
jgi:hypothetical protein